MKSKISYIFLSLCFLLALTACQATQVPDPEPVEPAPEITEPEAPEPEPEKEPESPAPDPDLSQRELDMIEDLEFLRETYKEKHCDPFYLCSEEEFDFKLDQVKAKVSELSDEDFYFDLCEVLAGMGDAHTSITPSEELSEKIMNRCFPIKIRSIGDKLYLYCYLEGYEQFAPYLLREVVAVNGIDMTYIEKKLADAAGPFNSRASKQYWDLVPVAFLDWAGCDYKEGYTFQILNGNQEVESIEVPVITSAEANGGTWVYPEGWGRIFFGKSEDWAEYVEGGDGGCVYLHYSILYSTPSIVKSFDTASTLIKEHPECKKLVIDMRDHPGGSAARLPQVRNSAGQFVSPAIEQVYVVTGGYTASAAVISLGIFQSLFDNMVVIGEPTGQFDPFLCVMNNEFVSPHLQYSVRISNMWYDAETDVEKYYDEDGKLYPWESCILPDVYIHQDIEDVRQGKDSVIEWVLAQ